MTEGLNVWAEVSLKNIAHNMNEIRKFVPSHVKIMGIVKADAFAHGAIEISKTILKSGANNLGVATIDEAIVLRENGITADIMLIAAVLKTRLCDVVKYDLTPTISNLDMAKALSEEAKQAGKTAKIEILIDTGMGRLGFEPTDKSVDEILLISKLPNIKISGVYTHLAQGESEDKTYTLSQHTKYMQVVDGLKAKGFTGFLAHISNSGGILNNQGILTDIDMFKDMVRPGLIIYGIHPSPDTPSYFELRPAMSVKARITHIQDLPEGVSVSYERTYYTKRPTRAATLAVGYADGYPSLLSNKGKAIVGDKIAPIIGSICMDMMMLDITGIDGVNVGDEVILFGKKGDLEVSAEEIAILGEAKSREIIAMSIIGKRIPRVYVD